MIDPRRRPAPGVLVPVVDWPRLLLTVAFSVGGGLALYHGVAAVLHVAYYERRWDTRDAWRIRADKPRPSRVAEAAWSGTRSMAMGGVISGLLAYAVQEGLPVPVFLEPDAYGWPYLIGSTALYFVLVEAAAYHAHRLLHWRPLYLRFHRYHHTYVAPIPHAALALHPVEFLIFQTVALLPIAFLPLHPVSIVLVLVYVLVYNIVDHSGIRLTSWWPWQPSTQFHDDHHRHFQVNYGQHLDVFDRLYGTLYRPGTPVAPPPSAPEEAGDAVAGLARTP